MSLGHISRDPAAGQALDPAGSENTQLDLNDLLTVDEVAALLKVSRSWVYEHSRSKKTAKSDRLPHIKIGKYVRFDARAVRAFLQRKCRTT
jgi:excisionase family DNA binding protein